MKVPWLTVVIVFKPFAM